MYLFSKKMELVKYLKPFAQTYNESTNFKEPSLRVYGIKIDENNLKDVPSIHEQSLSYIYGFICGLIATDGSVAPKNGKVTIFRSDQSDIEKISVLLNKIGMGVTSQTLYRLMSPYDDTIKPCYAVRVRRNSNLEQDFIR